jgi:predicted phosphodiesterase
MAAPEQGGVTAMTVYSNRLRKLYNGARRFRLSDDDKIVIFSDLHMGNGGKRDDFVHNAPLFKSAMERYYLKGDYDLVLNGDVEELHKFMMRSIFRSWPKIYNIFDDVEDKGGLYKIQGNHDSEKWLLGAKFPVNTEAHQGLRFDYKGNEIFMYHGHQTSPRGGDFENLAHYLLRYVARPMRLNNFAVSHNHRKKYNIEKRAYDFARDRKMMAIIGHTHRPLFESLSKVDYLKFRIEQMIREYPELPGSEKPALEKKIRKYRDELHVIMQRNRYEDFLDSLYNNGPVVPCLFNSGCAVGKRGMTALEIDQGRINLVHWFDSNITNKYFSFNGYSPERLDETSFYRVKLKSDELKYIFSRINLLA